MKSIRTEFPRAHGGPAGAAVLRSQPEDFVVFEQLGYEASGDGEHAFLKIRKRNLNTRDVINKLARFAGVKPSHVGYAGLKDRVAVTTQTFSVWLPGQADPDWQFLNDEQIQVVETARHGRKVRQGSLRGNRFELVLREFEGDPNVLEQRLQCVKAAGVPNYFGEQRFGRDRGNLRQVDDWFEGRGKRPGKNLRSILLSASRSWIFNLVLAERVTEGNWNTLVDGDVLMLEGSGRQFAQDPEDDALEGRMAALDIHPSGPLPGDRGHALEAERSAQAIEASVLADFPNWVEKLKSLRVDADRRALRVVPRELDWDIQGKDVEVRFALPAGAYATSVVRELVEAAPLER